jgi:hypothetical protein
VAWSLSNLNGALGRRRYNSGSEERKLYTFPEGFDIVQPLADRTRSGNARNAGQAVSNPPPKKRKAEAWTLEELELYRKHFGGEDMVMSSSSSNSSSDCLPDFTFHKAETRYSKSELEEKVHPARKLSARSPMESRSDLGDDADDLAHPLGANADKTHATVVDNVKNPAAEASKQKLSCMVEEIFTPATEPGLNNKNTIRLLCQIMALIPS